MTTKFNTLYNKIISSYNLSTDIVDKLYNDNQVKICENTYINKDNLFEWPNINSKRESNGYCHGTIDHVAILVDGTVIPCCLDSAGIINLGNVYKQDLNDIIGSDLFKEMKQGFLNNKKIHELCKKCNFYDLRR